MPHISLRSLSLAALPAALALAVVAMPAQAQNRDDRFVLRLSAFNPEAELGFSGNGTVTDLCTGLIWLKNMGCAPAQGLAAHMVWAANLANGQCNLTDGSQAGQWRLPTLPELTSLLDYSHNSIPDVLPLGHPFTNVQTLSYWSSTAQSSSYGWGVRLGNGWGNVDYQDKGNNGNALAVR